MAKPVLIACEVMRAELELLVEKHACEVSLLFLEQMLHETPEKLRAELQKAVDGLEGDPQARPSEILLGYGLCGRGLSGVRARRATMILPRVHDCIPLLLGVDQDASGEYSQSGGTYWLSPGWLGCSQVAFIREREERRRDYAARYGADNADYLMELEAGWLKNYASACLIRWPEFGDDWVRQARLVAADAGLPYREQAGREDYLLELLRGGRDPRRFLRVPAGGGVDIGPDGEIVLVDSSGVAAGQAGN